LLEDERLRRKMGERAREKALREATWRVRMEAYDRLLRELAGG
jgi:glycosyltransferase involved in cell wall biosynthesis